MYAIPVSLKHDIEAFSKHVSDYRNGEIEAVKFKAIRVPMGIYEQRQNGTFMVRIRCAAGCDKLRPAEKSCASGPAEGAEPIHITTRQGGAVRAM